MKKWMILLLALALTGCSKPAPEAQEPTVEEPPAIEAPVEMPEAPQEPQEQELRYEAGTSLFSDTLYAEDGTQLLQYSLHIPCLTVWREDGTQVTEPQNDTEKQALAAVETFDARFAEWYAEGSYADMEEAAKEQLAWMKESGLEWFGGYAAELTCSVYQTERLVSIRGTYYTNTGGAHPNTSLLSWNFDLENGTFFGPEILAEQTGLQETVTAELERQAEEKAAEFGESADMLFWPDYKDILADWPGYAVSFDESGMTVAYSPYELAAYAAGAQEFFLSYEWLRPHLDESALTALGLN